MSIDNTEEKQRGRPFEKGQSGNPNGRPKGSRNKAILAAESLLDGEAEQLTRKAIDLALNGDTTALKITLDRLLPARKERPICVDLPEVNNPGDIVKAINAVLSQVSEGIITLSEANTLMAILEQLRKAMETQELEARIAVLERKGIS